jgi:hypothetical protein
MYKTISNDIIRQFQLCYYPSKLIRDENEELPIKDWIQKYRNVVPAKDIVWLLLREEFLSVKDLRLFSVWCAREALKLIEKPDERSVNACNVAERYVNGEATKEEFLAAYDAAFAAVDISAYTVDYHAYYAAYYHVYYAAYYAIAADTDYAPYYFTALAAAHYASALAARNTVSRADANDAVRDAAYAARKIARTAQVDKLLTYF